MRLADFLSLEVALIRYEQWLVDDEYCEYGSFGDKLFWSHQYAMSSLQVIVLLLIKNIQPQKSVLSNLIKVWQVMKIRKHPKFNELPKEVMGLVFDKLVEMVKKGEKYDYHSGTESSSSDSDG